LKIILCYYLMTIKIMMRFLYLMIGKFWYVFSLFKEWKMIQNLYQLVYKYTFSLVTTMLAAWNIDSARILALVMLDWNWNDVEMLVAAKYCGQAPAVTNAYIASSSGSLTFSNTVTYSCYPGFSMTGSATITCQSSGVWTARPSCSSECSRQNKHCRIVGCCCERIGYHWT
jgi:hypothetical protein